MSQQLLKRYPSTPPSEEARIRVERGYRVLAPLTRLFTSPLLQLHIEGREHLPDEGPVLILCNHVSFWDPVVMMLATRRPVQLMATPSLLQEGILGWALGYFGAVPKAKYTRDLRAIRMLKAWARHGSAVGLFPEGQRSWDGRPLPLVPGIERLVRTLNVPLVTARIHNVDRVWPRWAARARRGRVGFEFDPPVNFSTDTDLEEIRAYIEGRIQLHPDDAKRWKVRGHMLARWVSNVVFSFPNCGSLDGLVDDDNHTTCRRCARRWAVDDENRLVGQHGAETLSLIAAIDRSRERFARSWVADVGRFEAEGVVLESEEMTLLDITDEVSKEVGQGRLTLTSEALTLPGSGWSVPLDKLLTATVDMRRRLQFRSKQGLFEAVMPTESVVKWKYVVGHWRAEARAARGSAPPPLGALERAPAPQPAG